MTEQPPPESQSSNIVRQDQIKQVKIGGVSIQGNLGHNVMVGDGSTTAVNIGGGSVTGDVYQVVSFGEAGSFDTVLKAFEAQVFQPDAKSEVKEALEVIKKEVDNGDKANEGSVYMLLREVGYYSPALQHVLAEWIRLQTTTPAIQAMAIEALSTT